MLWTAPPSAQDALRTILTNYPGIQSEVVSCLCDRLSESLSGETAQVPSLAKATPWGGPILDHGVMHPCCNLSHGYKQ